MNSGLLKKLVPHFIAIAIFLIITVIFCKQSTIHKKDNVLGQQNNAILCVNRMRKKIL